MSNPTNVVGEMRQHQKKINPGHLLYALMAAGETCTMPGVKWTGEGKDSHVLPCGKTSVGVGLFCDPSHIACQPITVCEKHKHRGEQL